MRYATVSTLPPLQRVAQWSRPWRGSEVKVEAVRRHVAHHVLGVAFVQRLRALPEDGLDAFTVAEVRGGVDVGDGSPLHKVVGHIIVLLVTRDAVAANLRRNRACSVCRRRRYQPRAPRDTPTTPSLPRCDASHSIVRPCGPTRVSQPGRSSRTWSERPPRRRERRRQRRSSGSRMLCRGTESLAMSAFPIRPQYGSRPANPHARRVTALPGVETRRSHCFTIPSWDAPWSGRRTAPAPPRHPQCRPLATGLFTFVPLLQ